MRTVGVLDHADQFGHKGHLVVDGEGGSFPPGLVALVVGEGVLFGDVVRTPPLGKQQSDVARLIKSLTVQQCNSLTV